MPSDTERLNYNAMQRKATISNAESATRQAEALERIASVLEDFFMHMYPAPAESVSVEPVAPVYESDPMVGEDHEETP
jgi:hypothetical protein